MSSSATAEVLKIRAPLHLVRAHDDLTTIPLPPRVKGFPELRYMGSKHRLLPWIHTSSTHWISRPPQTLLLAADVSATC